MVSLIKSLKEDTDSAADLRAGPDSQLAAIRTGMTICPLAVTYATSTVSPPVAAVAYVYALEK